MGITEEKTSQVSQMGCNSQILRIGIGEHAQSVFVSPRGDYTKLDSVCGTHDYNKGEEEEDENYFFQKY